MLTHRKFATALAATALAAGFAMTSAGSASAVPTARNASAVSVASVSCGYYSGTAETVRGNTGDRVREAQCLLKYWGYSSYLGTTGPNHDGVDGDFGSKTENAVKAFQTDTNEICTKKLSVDGKVGKHTWSALRAGDSCPTV